MMSTQEQDQIIGRLVRERKEWSERVVALSDKLARLSAAVRHAGGMCAGYAQENAASYDYGGARKGLDEMPSVESVAQTLDELHDARGRLAHLLEQLKTFGL